MLTVGGSSGSGAALSASAEGAGVAGSARFSPVPVRSALLGTVLAVTALSATTVFGASLTWLVHTPALYGVPYDARFSNEGPGSGAELTGPLLHSLQRDPAIDRVTGEPVRRYEHDHPGSLVHVDVKKLGNVPDGGGWRYVGRAQGLQNRIATAHRTGQRSKAYSHPLTGTAYIHTVLDDHSRVAYSEIQADETRETAVLVLRHAAAWFTARGVRIERVLSDNGSCYRSKLWAAACTELGITHKRTRPYRPQTNGKIERFHRTLAQGWAFKKFYASESARRAAFPAWLHNYNHHRPHTAIGRSAPITRLTNVPGQYS